MYRRCLLANYAFVSRKGLMLKIESSDTDLESLLTGRYFHIPRFQRPYSWDDENIQDFWDDLNASISGDYFIGSMVVYKMDKQAVGVVDGQQRLTTITIMLSVLRDVFLSLKEPDLAAGVYLLIERNNRDNKKEFVLKPETSYPYFQERIQRSGGPRFTSKARDEEKSIERARNLLQKKVETALSSIESSADFADEPSRVRAKVDQIRRLRDSLLNLKIILVVLDDEDDAYVIFETLNTRGKDLAVSDLLKNHFTKLLKSDGDVDSVKIRWTELIETIYGSNAEISPDSFLYHYWASWSDYIPLKRLFQAMKDQIVESNAEIHLNDMVADAKLYRAIYEPVVYWPRNERKVVASLTAIQLFKLSQPMPALLSLARAHRDGAIKTRKLQEALGAIENFHFLFTAVTSSRSSGGISGMYAAFARKLYEAGNDSNLAAKEISALVSKLRERKPSFEEFRVNFGQVTYTNAGSKQRSLVRYVLRRFFEHENLLSAADFEEMTIEHIQPQATYGHDWSDSEIGQLGNLLLIDSPMNGRLDRKPFPEKKKMLLSEGYKLPKSILGEEDWTAEIVRSRTDHMAKVAYDDIWRI